MCGARLKQAILLKAAACCRYKHIFSQFIVIWVQAAVVADVNKST